ncbi:hypothetical protein [Shimia biformata]|uniref:hypothetical protein n=1 Tax=Shimia biformata TaxID=1294299 RepID=UPI00194FD938|nr:hypothetical protein [Shimia biformata]
MKTKSLICAFLLALAPVSAMAMGCGPDHFDQTASCKAGTVWDSTSRTCVPKTTS